MQIQLSISLLASNRAASLERCLDSLRPLLMQIPSELIIVFTGTDERVKEIASRYTDKILHFTWCDNFSAARNVGLWAAKGEWFLYIDDDEWFEDVTEIRDFFLSGEYKNYGSACYKQKNYINWNGIEYSDYHAFRMARIVPGLVFQNTVHEELVPRIMPCKYFEAYVNHYGYISDGRKGNAEKTSRNLPLLLQNIRERPSYVKNYLQAVQEYVIAENWKKAEEYCREGLRLCHGYEDDFYRGWLQVNLLTILCKKNEFEKAQEEALHILEQDHPRELIRLDIYETLLAIYTRREADEETLYYGSKFEETLDYMDQHPELWRRQTYADVTEDRIKMPDRLYQIRINCTECALKQGDMVQAVYFLGRLPWEEESWMQRYYPVFDKWKELWAESFRELLGHFPEQTPYLLLQNAISQASGIEKEKQQDLFVQCVKGTESVYLQQQALKEAVLHQMDLADIVSLIELDTWKTYAAELKKSIPGNEIGKLETVAERLACSTPVYGAWLKKLLCEKDLIRGYLIGDALVHALEKYIGYILQFYQLQYRDDMFHADKQNLLPKDCRFAVCVSEALEKMECGEFPEAVRLFRKSLRFEPTMTSVIREMIREMSVKINNPTHHTGDEFQALALQMKAALNTMIENQQYAESLPVILQLCPLLPEDLELLKMRQKVLREIIE